MEEEVEWGQEQEQWCRQTWVVRGEKRVSRGKVMFGRG